eukprot:93163-Hanusia_phi.AAC.2
MSKPTDVEEIVHTSVEPGPVPGQEATELMDRLPSRPGTQNSWVQGKIEKGESEANAGSRATGVQVFQVVSDDSESETDAPSPPPPEDGEPPRDDQRRPFPSLADLVDSESENEYSDKELPSPPSSAASSEDSFMHKMEESRMFAGVQQGEFDEHGGVGMVQGESSILEKLQELKLRETQLEAKIREKRKRARKAQEDVEKKEEEYVAVKPDEHLLAQHDHAAALVNTPSPDPEVAVAIQHVPLRDSYLKSLNLKDKVEYEKMTKRWPRIRSTFLLIFYDAVFKTNTLRKLRKRRLAEMMWYIIFVTIISLCIIQARSYMPIFNFIDTLKRSMWTSNNITDMKSVFIDLQGSVLFQNVSDLKTSATKLTLRTRFVGNNIIAGDVQLRQWKVPLVSCRVPAFVEENQAGVCFLEYTKRNHEVFGASPSGYLRQLFFLSSLVLFPLALLPPFPCILPAPILVLLVHFAFCCSCSLCSSSRHPRSVWVVQLNLLQIRTMPPGQHQWMLDSNGLVPSWGYWIGGGGKSYIPLESFLARVYDQGAYTADLNGSHDNVGGEARDCVQRT